MLRHVVLDGYSCLRGVSLVGGGVDLHVVLRVGAEFDPDWAVGVAGLVRVVAVQVADGGMGAGRAFLAVGQIAWVGFRFVGASTHCAGWAVLVPSCRVAILLTGAALGAEAEADVFFDPAFPVADDEVVASEVTHPDIASQGHDDSGGLLVEAFLRGSQPAWGLGLDYLGVICGDAVGDFG